MLRACERAIDGIQGMLERVVDEASQGCLGVGSIVEFGCRQPELVKIRDGFGRYLNEIIMEALLKARAEGDVGPDLDLEHLGAFLLSTIAAIRIAARGGASPDQVAAIAQVALRALR